MNTVLSSEVGHSGKIKCILVPKPTYDPILPYHFPYHINFEKNVEADRFSLLNFGPKLFSLFFMHAFYTNIRSLRNLNHHKFS